MSKDKEVAKKAPEIKTSDKPAIEAKQGRERPKRITRDMLVNKGPLRVPESAKKSGMVNFWMKDGPYTFDRLYTRGYDYALDGNDQIVRVGRSGETMILLEIPQELYDQTIAQKIELKEEITAERQELNQDKSRSNVRADGIFEEELKLTKA